MSVLNLLMVLSLLRCYTQKYTQQMEMVSYIMYIYSPKDRFFHQLIGLSTQSPWSPATFPETHVPIFVNEPKADKFMKQLLPTLRVRDNLNLVNFEELKSMSHPSPVFVLAINNRQMLLLQRADWGSEGMWCQGWACCGSIGLLRNEHTFGDCSLELQSCRLDQRICSIF